MTFFSLIVSIAFGLFFFSTSFTPLFLGLVSVMIFVAMSTRTAISFSLCLASVFFLAFYNVFSSWNSGESLALQWANISMQLVLSVIIVLSWLFGHQIRNLKIENKELHTSLRALQKIEERTNLFTLNEFIDKTKLLFTGAKRRNEHLVLMEVSFTPDVKSYKTRLVSEQVAHSLFQSVRTEYDLLCQVEQDRFLLLLNNPSETGIAIVEERIQEQATTPLHFRVQPSFETWNELQTTLQKFQKEEIAS